MSDFRILSDQVLASPQITPNEIEAAKQMGVTLIVNNRPEGEAPDQTPGAEIERAAIQAGLDYVAIPITQAGFSLPQVEAMGEALAKATGKVLAYCRSGTRSTFLWSLAEAKRGTAPGTIASAAQQAGYDIAPIKQMLEMLSGQTGN